MRRLPALASLLAALALVVAGQTTRADLVVGYDAIDVFPLATKTLAPINGSGVAGSVLSTFALANRTGGGSNYTWSGFPTGAPVYGQGFNFAFTSATPYNLSTLELKAERSAIGPMMLELFVDTGSGFVSMGSSAVPTTAATMSYNLALASVTSAAFQLRGYNAGNSGSMATFSLMDSGDLDGTADLAVFGTVAVPEASPFLFGGALCGVLGLWRLRRNRCLAEARI